MRSKVIFMFAALVSTTAVTGAYAATGTVPFTGIVTTTCALTVGTPGIIAPSADYTSLSSTAAGGSAGTVAALATGAAFKVSTVAPSSFTAAPATGGDNVSFSSTYSGSGSTTIGSTSGASQTTLNPGVTNLNVNLSATKGSGVFAGGAYAAEVIVRCE